MTHDAPVRALLLTCLLLGWTAADASIICPWMRVLPNEQVHYTFLRRDPLQASPSLRLYHTAWAGGALLGCAWSDHAAVTHNYLSLCHERAKDFVDSPPVSLDLESVFEVEDMCISVAFPDAEVRAGVRAVRSARGRRGAGRSEVRGHPRVKRGFIVPGTLWCGSGNKAPSYEDLGVFSDTDNCCREHDQCKDTILSFQSQFGVFNSNIFTMSHCDCDNKFRRCLMEANDSISDVVGYTFFNLLKMHCFEFSYRLQCTQRNWFGMCKESKMALYAEVYPPTQYESDNPPEGAMNISIINTTVPRDHHLESSTWIPPLSSSSTAAASTPSSASITPNVNISRPEGSVQESRDHQEKTIPTKNWTQTHLDADYTEMQRSCIVYKDLDECRIKILPQQRRFGLHNLETKTLYHCNCTSRLFQSLATQRKLSDVQTLLLGHVSKSCFTTSDCTGGNICTAVAVSAQLPQLERINGSDMEEQRHLQAVRLKIRRPNSRRAKRKDRAVRLHKLCLKMVRVKFNQTNSSRQ